MTDGVVGRRIRHPSVGAAAGLAALGVGLVLLAARWAGRVSWEEMGQIALLILGVAVLLVAIVFTGGPRRLWVWCSRKARQAMEATDATGTADPELFWFVPLATLLTLVAGSLAIVGVLAADLVAWSQLWPWMLVGVALLFALLALMAISYAPPGPNWVHRIAGVDGSALIMVVGIGGILLGTYQLFDYDAGDAASQWWLALVGTGLFVGLIGINRSRSARRRIPARPPATEAAAAARRAKTAARRIGRYRDEIADQLGSDDPLAREAARAASSAAEWAEQARAAADQVTDLETSLGDKTEVARGHAVEIAKLARRIGDAARQTERSSSTPPGSEESP